MKVREQAPPPSLEPKPIGIERRLYPSSKVSASSFLEPKTLPYLQYHPNYVLDGDPKTAWNEGAPGDGSGEYLTFNITPQDDVSRVRLRILNGFQYSDVIYKANPRAKTIEVTLSPSGKPHRFVLADDKAWQEIAFATETPVLAALQLKVIDSYPGNRWHRSRDLGG